MSSARQSESAGLRAPVLVTGAAGFIGRRVVARLLEQAVEVVALALPGEEIPGAWGDRVRVVRGDVRSAVDVERAIDGVGCVIHLAALVGAAGLYDEHWNVTALGSRNVYEFAAAQGARVVVTSSICAYGDLIAKQICSEDSGRGAYQGPYGRAKQAQEDFALEAHAERGLAVSIVRPANVYGIGSRPWVEGLAAAIKIGMVKVLGDGAGNAGLVHVENLVDALLMIAASEASVGRIYNVCDGLDVSWRRYMDDLARAVGVPPPASVALEPLLEAALGNENPAALQPPKDPAIFPLELLNLVGSDNRFDATRLREELGWLPRVGYAEALAEIEAHLQSRAAG